jgi:hypothetical protein
VVVVRAVPGGLQQAVQQALVMSVVEPVTVAAAVANQAPQDYQVQAVEVVAPPWSCSTDM